MVDEAEAAQLYWSSLIMPGAPAEGAQEWKAAAGEELDVDRTVYAVERGSWLKPHNSATIAARWRRRPRAITLQQR